MTNQQRTAPDIGNTEILCNTFDPQKKSKEAKKAKLSKFVKAKHSARAEGENWAYGPILKDCNNHKSWNKQVSKLMSKNQSDWCYVVHENSVHVAK